jgi:flagellar biosynthesis protein FliQ
MAAAGIAVVFQSVPALVVSLITGLLLFIRKALNKHGIQEHTKR